MRICETFYSLQGEGLLQGVPSFFVRLAGCNQRCSWCDTPYAWNAADGYEMSVDRIVSLARKVPVARHCVLTGGEPMLASELPELARALRRAGYHVTIETNATLPPNGVECDLASLSPKLRHAGSHRLPIAEDCLRQWLDHCDSQLKLVCSGRKDGPEIRDLVAMLQGRLPLERILLMPLSNAKGEIPAARRQEVVGLCLEHGFRYAGRLHYELFGGRRGY